MAEPPLEPQPETLSPALEDAEPESLHEIVEEEKHEFVRPASRDSKLALAIRALRHRNFQLFFAGQLISLVGTWMQTVAQSWLVYRMTNSALLLGTVGFASQIPVFIMAPVGGIVADRRNRQRVVIATQAASMVLAGILAALTLTHRVHVWHIMVLAAGLGVVNAFDIPARQAFLIDMVGREDLINAIALNSSMFNGARIIGPAIAGILVASIGEGWCFFANAVSYIAVIIGLMLMQIERPANLAKEGSPLQHILEGFAFARNTLPIRALLLLLGLVSFVGMPYTVLMPVFADRILHGGARGLGILMGATGVGALLGAASLAARVGVRGTGPADCHVRCRLRVESGAVRVLKNLLALNPAAAARRLFHDGADGSVQHAHSGHGSGSTSRPHHGGVLDDVHGHGAVWGAVGRRDRAPRRRAVDRRGRRPGLHSRRGLLLDKVAHLPARGARTGDGAGHDGRHSRARRQQRRLVVARRNFRPCRKMFAGDGRRARLQPC